MVCLRPGMLIVLAWVAIGPVSAQVDVANGLKAYQEERADAAKRFPVESLAIADSLAARAVAGDKAKDPRAIKYLRDARWALPYTPPGLPANVSRVFGTGRMRHSDRVTGLAYLPDGLRLVSSSRDGTARVWNLANGAELMSYRGHPDVPNAPNSDKPDSAVSKVSSVAVHPTQPIVATAGVDGVHLWNPDTGKLIRILPIKTKATRSIAFSPDGARLVTGSDDNVVRLWDITKETPLFATKALSGRIEDVAYSPKSNMIAAVTIDGKLNVFSIKDDKEKLLLGTLVSTPSGSLNAVIFSPEGTGIFTAGDDKIPKLTSGPSADGTSSPTSAATVRSFPGHVGPVSCCALTTNGNLLVTGGYAANDQTVRVWDANTGKSLRVYQGHSGHITSVAIRNDGNEIASGDEIGVIRLWPLAVSDEHRSSTEATDSLWAAVVSPGGTRTAAAGADRTVRVYDTLNGKLQYSMTGHTSAITTLCFLNDELIASAGGDKVIKLWDLKTGKLQKDFVGHESVIFALSATVDGKTVFSGSADKTIKAWDAATGKILWNYIAKSAVCAVASSPDGKSIAAGTADGWLLILEPVGTTPQIRATLPAHTGGVASVVYSATAKRVATGGGDGSLKIWNISDTGNATIQLALDAPPTTNPTGTPGPISSVALSPGDRTVASAGADGIIRIYDTSTGKETRSLRAHLDWVTAISFATTGLGIYSASVDKTARLFELSTSDTGTQPGLSRTVRALAISPNGKQFVTAISDQPVKLWDFASGKELASLTGAMGELNAIAFADAETVLVGEEKGRVVWLSTKTNKEIANAATGRVYTLAPAATPDKAIVWVVPQDSKNPPPVSSFEILSQGGKPAVVTAEKKQTISCAAISPDGTWAVTGTPEGKIRFYDLATQKAAMDDWPLFTGYVVDVAITANKETIVSVDDTGTVKIGDVAKRTVTKSFKAHDKAPNGIILAKTGTAFLTLGADNDLKVWDMTGKELRTWKLQAGVAAAAFTPDGKQILTANNDGTLFVLDLPDNP